MGSRRELVVGTRIPHDIDESAVSTKLCMTDTELRHARRHLSSSPLQAPHRARLGQPRLRAD